MLTAAFWQPAIERAIKSAAQALILLLGADTASILSIDWQAAAGLTGTAFVLSILTSVVSSSFGPDGSPSLVPDANAAPPAIAP